MKQTEASKLGQLKRMRRYHINPNCENAKYCYPHNEFEKVEYDWEKINKDLEILNKKKL